MEQSGQCGKVRWVTLDRGRLIHASMRVRFAPKATDVLRRRGRQPVGRLAEDPERAVRGGSRARSPSLASGMLAFATAAVVKPRSAVWAGLSGGTLSHRSWREGQQQKPRHWATVAGFLRSVHRGSIDPSTTLRHDTQMRRLATTITIPVMSTAKQENSRRSLRSICILPPPLTFPPC